MEVSFCAAKPIQYQKISALRNSVTRKTNSSYKTRSPQTNSDCLARMNRETRDANIFQKFIKAIKAIYRRNHNI